MEKQAPKTITITLATGLNEFAGRTETVSTYEEAARVVRDFQRLAPGDADEKIDYSVVFEDDETLEGTLKIKRSDAFIHFGSAISSGIQLLLSDDPEKADLRKFIDRDGSRREQAREYATRYDFGVDFRLEEPSAGPKL